MNEFGCVKGEKKANNNNEGEKDSKKKPNSVKI